MRKPNQLAWTGARHDFPGTTYIHPYGYFGGITSELEFEDDTRTLFLIDCNQWPPAEVDLSELRPDVDGANLLLVGAEGERRYWRRLLQEGAPGTGDVFQYEVSTGAHFENLGPPVRGDFHHLDCIVDAGVLYGLHRVDDSADWPVRRCVARIDGAGVTTVLVPGQDVVLTGLGPGRILVSASNQHMASLDEAVYWLWDEGRAEALTGPHRYPAIPVQPYEALAWLGGDGILFCSKTSVPHEHNIVGHEHTLQLHRFDVLTGAHAAAALEGFGSTLKVPTTIYKTEPRQTALLQSFEGKIDIVAGGAGWWILNYGTQMPGKKTVCWLWHQHTNAVVKIMASDLPGLDVLAVLYAPGIDRYLVSVPNAILQLAGIDAITEKQGTATLSWT
ncbi:hypothetical protein IP91_03076 [Pseudoduganella lurida]|uniref:Uncharacterized protein n=1 Tax=Pseudoduganella lurida TaxID=1036180 RepID=A0A562R5H4_9BURK|nr:hypothetical protein [Pseudoduganella lurida]TWI64307.1 hypothetical protein IP91_03076 [Pseudoduganella lurida]